MHKTVRKIMLMIITVIFTLTTFTGVTFAWLSINSDAWIEGMQIQATAGKGFLISVDNVSYKSNLRKDDLMKAVILKYRRSYSLDENGNLLDEAYEKVEPKDYAEIFNKIQLQPCTSYNMEGIELSNLNGTIIDPSKGEYLEFDIYFKSTGELTKDLNIYLNGLDTVLHQDGNKYDVNRSRILSDIDSIQLLGNLVTFDKFTGESIHKKYDDIIEVSSANAMRIGVIDELSKTTIVELTNEYDLGSYATNISDYVDEHNALYDENVVYDAKMDANKNAMFTYVADTAERLEPIDYKNVPKTIRSLTIGGTNSVCVAKLVSSQPVKKATFRIWLEGWDADCLDGLTKSIKVQLSFVQQD